jgi:hypothetical protein
MIQGVDMFKVAATAAALLTIALAACSRTTPEPSSDHSVVPSVTAVGSRLGAVVTQTITASGGKVSIGAVVVSAPPGAFTNAQVRVQAITNTLSDAMESIEISSDVPWSKYLTITMPINKTDRTPGGLGLAVQQADGSWLSLEPVKVDVAAGTVSSVLPVEAPTKPESHASLNLISVAQAAKPAPTIHRLGKFYRFYLEPESATVPVTKSVDFTPYARVDAWTNCQTQTVDGQDELAALDAKCLQVVQQAKPFTNDKPGFTRGWDINSNVDGNPLDGIIVAKKPIGATYTAPSKVPNPDHVTVEFISAYADKLRQGIDEDKFKKGMYVDLKAEVKISDPEIPVYTGSITMHVESENANQFWDNTTWDIQGDVTVRKDPSTSNSYPVSSSNMSATVRRKGCNTVQLVFQLDSDMQLHLPDTQGEPVRYGFDFEGRPTDATQLWTCVGKDGAGLTAPVSMSGSSIKNHCDSLETMIESTSNPDLLEGSRSYTCPMGLPTQSYKTTFTWRLHRQNSKP